MADGYIGLATAGFQALASVAKEIPVVRKLFSSQDDRIRQIAKELQSEIVHYCNHLESCIKEARNALGHDKELLAAPLNAVDAMWYERNRWWNTFLRRSPSKRVKSALQQLDGFGDRLTALLICQEQNEELQQRARIDGERTVAYSALLGKNLSIQEILDRIDLDVRNLRKEAAGLGTL